MGRLNLALMPLVLLMLSLPASAAQQLSFQGLMLGDKEYVEGFNVDTFNVSVLAVCKIPDGWTVTAGNYVGNGGTLQGGGTGGVAGLDRKHLGVLTKLFLVEDVDLKSAKLDGKLMVNTYGTGAMRTIPLLAANYRFSPAKRCP